MAMTTEEMFFEGKNYLVLKDYLKAAIFFSGAAKGGHTEAKKLLDSLKTLGHINDEVYNKLLMQKSDTSSSASSAPAPSARSAPASQPAQQTGGGSSSKGGIVPAILLGLVSAAMLLLTAIMLINNLSAFVTLALWAVVFVAGFILFFIAWRNKKTVMIIILAVLSIGGMLYAFSRPSSPKPAATKTANANATVNANVNFRSGPSTDNAVIRQLKQGDTVTLTGEVSGSWTQIRHNGDVGWVSTEFLNK